MSHLGKEPDLNEMHIVYNYESNAQNAEQTQHAHEKVSDGSSIWISSGENNIFNSKKAHKIGDIIKVKVKISDKASLDNTTQKKRDTKEKLGIPRIFGFQNKINSILPTAVDPTKLLDISGGNSNIGSGKIGRSEKIETEVAAMIVNVLPNGNLIINGHQEIRLNFEVRELTIKGIARPADLNADNTIDSSKIAELRISYGGRGHISDAQQPRLGTQIIDIISPF